MKAPKIILKTINSQNNRGIAVVYIALLLVVLLAFVGLAIDIGYMYVTKTQLQNAADAAAHAGASKLLSISGAISNLNDPIIAQAKNEAVNFALNNKAAGENILILSDGTNVLSDTNDVTVGNWDGASYTANTTPVNALEARARRTDNSPGGKVAIFFGKVIGISEMAASADAVAALPLRAGIFIALCLDSCGSTVPPYPMQNYSSGKQFDTGPQSPYDNKFAWTTLLNDPTSSNALDKLICNDKPMQNVCNKSIYTNMGTITDTLRNLASQFYDINYDSANKEFITINNKKVVTGWNLIIPITNTCPPGLQGNWEPAPVYRYARIKIRAVCAVGNAPGCYGDLPNLKNACKDGLLPARNCCSNFDNNTIVIDRIQCVDCTDETLFSGTRIVIVK